MDERVLKWLKANTGKVFASPRNARAHDLKLLGIFDDGVRVHFVGSEYRALPLRFWMFDRTLEYIRENKDRAVRLGAKLIPPYESDTVEGQIWKKPYPTGNTSYKAAPHICDILALAGLVEYVLVLDPKTCRRVQAVKLLNRK